jgi:hypothetical protein
MVLGRNAGQQVAEAMEGRFQALGDEETIFSDDMNESLRTRCGQCGKEVNLCTLGKHTRARHGLPLKDYRARWGDPRLQLLQLVVHRCRRCQRPVPLDHDELERHMRTHNETFQDYAREFLVPSKTDPFQKRERAVSPARATSPEGSKVEPPMKTRKVSRRQPKVRRRLMTVAESLAVSALGSQAAQWAQHFRALGRVEEAQAIERQLLKEGGEAQLQRIHC